MNETSSDQLNRTVTESLNRTVNTTVGFTVKGIQTTAESTKWFIGFTRDGLAAAGNRVSTPSTRAGFNQVASLFFASTMIGLGVALFVRADLGVPAYDVMLTAISGHLGISLGQSGWLFSGALFAVAAVLGQRPRPAALAFIVGNGLAVDTFMQVVRQPDGWLVRIGFVGLGTMIIAGGVALVVHAGLGGGATELLMRAGEERGFNPFRVRTALEAGVVLTGILLGGSFGPATVFFVLTISPILQAGQRALHDHRTGRRLRIQSTP